MKGCIFYKCSNMSRQDQTESKTICQSIETTEITNEQNAEVLPSPDPLTSNIASTEGSTLGEAAFNAPFTSLPADIEPTHHKVVTLRYGHGAVNPSQDGYVDSTSPPPSGNHIYTCPLPSPGISDVQLHEFLDLPETQDISAGLTDTTNSGSYVPMQARPLLSYTEHQRAIYFPGPQFPVGFDPHELIHLDDSMRKSVNGVSGEYLDVEELYDMSLKAVHENRP